MLTNIISLKMCCINVYVITDTVPVLHIIDLFCKLNFKLVEERNDF